MSGNTIVNNVINAAAPLGGGQDRGWGKGGGSQDGIDSIAYKFFQKAMQDGKLDKREMQTLQKLAKAEQEQKGHGKGGCDDKDDKKDCRDKKDCDDKKDCRSDNDKDKDCNKNDRLLSKYIDQAMEDGKLSRFEQKMIDRLLEGAKRN